MNREQMIEEIIEYDMDMYEIQLNQMTDEQLQEEYEERFK